MENINYLEVDGISLEYDNINILQNVYLKLETNSVIGLLGRNGVGKSSLLKIIFGTLSAEEKSIRLNGELIQKKGFNNGIINYLPQFSFIPKFLSIKRVFNDFNANESVFYNYFPKFPNRNTEIGELSSGERKLVAFFLVITSKSKFTLLDEPYAFIMPKHIETINEIILAQKKHKGILISDHNYTEVFNVVDASYLLKDGSIIPVNSINDLKRNNYIL